jgi:hypothetical protein
MLAPPSPTPVVGIPGMAPPPLPPIPPLPLLLAPAQAIGTLVSTPAQTDAVRNSHLCIAVRRNPQPPASAPGPVNWRAALRPRTTAPL